MVILGATAESAQASFSIVMRVLLLVALLIPLAAATLWLRRWIHQEEGADVGAPFTLHQIQELFRRGELTQAQYDRLRQQVIAQARVMGSEPPKKPPSQDKERNKS
jgi:hypothetical protein